MSFDAVTAAATDRRSGPRRRDRHGRGLRSSLIPMHLPGFHTRREVFDQVAANAAADLLERFPRRLQHLRVLVEDVPPADPAPWESRTASLGRSLPGTRETPPRAVLHRLPIQTRCSDRDHLELLIRQVLSEQVGSLLGMAAEDVDPDAWGD